MLPSVISHTSDPSRKKERDTNNEITEQVFSTILWIWLEAHFKEKLGIFLLFSPPNSQYPVCTQYSSKETFSQTYGFIVCVNPQHPHNANTIPIHKFDTN